MCFLIYWGDCISFNSVISQNYVSVPTVSIIPDSQLESVQIFVRKLITSGYPCVELKSGTADEALGALEREHMFIS